MHPQTWFQNLFEFECAKTLTKTGLAGTKDAHKRLKGFNHWARSERSIKLNLSFSNGRSNKNGYKRTVYVYLFLADLVDLNWLWQAWWSASLWRGTIAFPQYYLLSLLQRVFIQKSQNFVIGRLIGYLELDLLWPFLNYLLCVTIALIVQNIFPFL